VELELKDVCHEVSAMLCHVITSLRNNNSTPFIMKILPVHMYSVFESYGIQKTVDVILCDFHGGNRGVRVTL
jgi:hypothetical protein